MLLFGANFLLRLKPGRGEGNAEAGVFGRDGRRNGLVAL